MITGAAALVVVGVASTAFACSAQPRVYSIAPESAAPGETVLVRGQVPSSVVEIRWNGVGGEVLAVAGADASGDIAVPVKIPDVAPGIYSLTVATANAGVGRTAIEVTAPAGVGVPAPAAPALWPGLTDPSVVAASTPPGVSSLGVALLGVGLVGLLAGSTVAVARSRRAPAAPSS